ncbi:MAG: hypothetical protein ACFCUQ_12630, partial [Kiloniellales bacterium]
PPRPSAKIDSARARARVAGMSLTTDIILKFLKARRAGGACPSCATNEWSIATTGTSNTAQLPIGQEHGFQIPPVHIPLVVLICKNCGFIRAHSKKLIDQWAEAEGLLPEFRSDE